MAARVVVVGAGIFGLTGAHALRRRGYDVVVVDPEPLTRRDAESTDVSRLVRIDYGGDETYVDLMERAVDGWRSWLNEHARPVFHETGVLVLSSAPVGAGGFEDESARLLGLRGHRVEPVDRAALERRFPSWKGRSEIRGYFNPTGGWVEPRQVIASLLTILAGEGVRVFAGEATALREERSGGASVLLRDGVVLTAEHVVLAAGAWSSSLCPTLSRHVRTFGVPVFNLAVAPDLDLSAREFPAFSVDTATGGYYGFPRGEDGYVKIAHNALGRPMVPECSDRSVVDVERQGLKAFLAQHLPSLSSAPVHTERICVYSTTDNERFVISPDPDQPSVVVASAGSGHAFKFAPVLGDLIANAVEGRVDSFFGWPAP